MTANLLHIADWNSKKRQETDATLGNNVIWCLQYSSHTDMQTDMHPSFFVQQAIYYAVTNGW